MDTRNARLQKKSKKRDVLEFYWYPGNFIFIHFHWRYTILQNPTMLKSLARETKTLRWGLSDKQNVSHRTDNLKTRRVLVVNGRPRQRDSHPSGTWSSRDHDVIRSSKRADKHKTSDDEDSLALSAWLLTFWGTSCHRLTLATFRWRSPNQVIMSLGQKPRGFLDDTMGIAHHPLGGSQFSK